MKSKSPYKAYTIDEIEIAEASSYVIQVGADFFCHKGMFCFSEKSAVTLYNKILANLADLLANGDAKQRKEARNCLSSLKVMQLRIH